MTQDEMPVLLRHLAATPNLVTTLMQLPLSLQETRPGRAPDAVAGPVDCPGDPRRADQSQPVKHPDATANCPALSRNR